MENKIELFDRYIDGDLKSEEKLAFDRRLSSDKSFATDFGIYLFTLKGIFQEAEQDNMEFGHAMKNISKEDLLHIIGRNSSRRVKRLDHLRERLPPFLSLAYSL